MAALCLSAATPALLAAQEQKPPGSAAEALEALRTASRVGKAFSTQHIQSMLAQAHRPYPPATLDSLGDGLARIAIEAAPGDVIAINAMTALAAAGSAQSPVPYPRAFELLVEIYEGAGHPGTRGAAMALLYKLADRERALQFWAHVAQSEKAAYGGAQTMAIEHLARLGGERGREILRDLHSRRVVKEPDARNYLRWLAERDFVVPGSQPPHGS